MSVAVGQTIGPYEVEALAGRGSMADVYRARHQTTGQVVAVKLIHSYLLDQPSQLSRFRREAETLKKIQHPNIAQFYDFVVEPGMAYIVLEYLEGGTLEQRLASFTTRREQLPLETANEWMRVICGAVEYAHRHGLVHRDLKPANIIFRSAGEPVLTDFGLVYGFDQPRLSGTGSVTGTPAYISPEQARGHAGDKRSDVYSLGVILYELLAGQPPFQGHTLGVAVKHISELPPSPRVYGRYLPAGVEAVVMRALAKEPIERYQSAILLSDALSFAVARTAAPPTASAANGGGVRSAPAGGAAARPAPIVSLPDAAPPQRVIRDYDYEPEPFTLPPPPANPLQVWLTRLGALAALAAVAASLWWVSVSFTGWSTPAVASSSPQFSVGASVRVVTTNPQASVSVLRGCPTGFWLGVVGMASAGDVGKVVERRVCGDQWWYRVSIPAAADAEWNGDGWVEGVYLTTR